MWKTREACSKRKCFGIDQLSIAVAALSLRHQLAVTGDRDFNANVVVVVVESEIVAEGVW